MFYLVHRMKISRGGKRESTRVNLMMFIVLMFTGTGVPADTHTNTHVI